MAWIYMIATVRIFKEWFLENSEPVIVVTSYNILTCMYKMR